MELIKRNPTDLMITKEILIHAPMEVVFSVLEDISLFVELEENVKRVDITSPVARGKGMVSHWELEDPATHETWSVDEEVIAYEYPRLFVYAGRAADGKDYTGSHALIEQGDGQTLLRFTEIFYFPGNLDLLDRIVAGMVNNIKTVSEQRSLQSTANNDQPQQKRNVSARLA